MNSSCWLIELLLVDSPLHQQLPKIRIIQIINAFRNVFLKIWVLWIVLFVLCVKLFTCIYPNYSWKYIEIFRIFLYKTTEKYFRLGRSNLRQRNGGRVSTVFEKCFHNLWNQMFKKSIKIIKFFLSNLQGCKVFGTSEREGKKYLNFS